MRLANYLKVRTTDGQTDGLMDQLFTLTWFLTTVFYEASVVTKFCGKTRAPRPLPLLRPGPEPFRFAKAFKPTYVCLGTSLVFELIVGSSFIHCIHVEARVNCKRKQIWKRSQLKQTTNQIVCSKLIFWNRDNKLSSTLLSALISVLTAQHKLQTFSVEDVPQSCNSVIYTEC